VTTAADWVHETRHHLLSGEREQVNRLDGAIVSAGASTFVYEFTTFGGIQPGAVVEIDTELMYVFSVNTGTRTATVQRGYQGTTAATHSDDALITVNPRFPSHAVLRALNQELLSLSSPQSGMFRVAVEELTYTVGVTGYDLDLPGFIDVIEVHALMSETSDWWKRVALWRVANNMATSDFASGRALMLGDGGIPSSGRVRVTYKRSYGTVAALGDDVTTATGIATEAEDIPPLGAAVRLALPRGIKRSFDESQGEPRRAAEVEANAMVQNAAALLQFRNQRVSAEVARLKALYPIRLPD
jgi:hypothetical protein